MIAGLPSLVKKPVPLNIPCSVFGGVSVVGCHVQCSMSALETCAKDCISSAAKPWCVVTPNGMKTELGRVVSPFRWGSDSLAYVESEKLMVRPLGGGVSRVITWSRPPITPRDGTYWAP